MKKNRKTGDRSLGLQEKDLESVRGGSITGGGHEFTGPFVPRENGVIISDSNGVIQLD